MINDLLHAHRAFNKILKMLALGKSQDKMLEQLISVTESIFNDRLTSILLLNPNTNTLHFACAPSLPEFYYEAIDGVTIGPQIVSCGAAAYHRQKVITENIDEHQNWSDFLPLAQKANLASCWSVPIISSKNKVLGTFATYGNAPSKPTPFELEVLEMAASVCAVTLEKHEIEQELMQSATYDFLTNVYNRRAFCQKLQHELDDFDNDRGLLVLFYIDINDFKAINDQYGHIFGDKILVETANRLTKLCRQPDIVGRLGGDEFVLLASLSDEEEFTQLYQQLIYVISNKVSLENVSFSASVGYSIVKQCELENYNIQYLISEADANMYNKKQKLKQSRL
ncbi:sensor domain-containing diguanylate cyclase [Photobacterium sp. SDRW27]|uniref:sensor domain-containing diguanylate cyclase n=1 Tax=Photobacterium obscurum TaxID=2829490 RepID=UPI002244A723|nr:sensor domain-containing diguanylate cyclase [Photobacterium obscurum]MCW8329363.1 sensor domain-containing diguanylate cyclase [Photobacterium obscurum]